MVTFKVDFYTFRVLHAETIDQEKKVSHSRLADMIESVISEPSKIEVKLKVNLLVL